VAPEAIHAELSAMLIDPGEKKNAAVYLAAYENKLASDVAAGENRGKRLEHDFVVREWIGRSASATHEPRREACAAAPSAPAEAPGVAAFVQNRSNSEVLQALIYPSARTERVQSSPPAFRASQPVRPAARAALAVEERQRRRHERWRHEHLVVGEVRQDREAILRHVLAHPTRVLQAPPRR